MRTFAEIDAEIAEVEKKLELLHEERAEAATAKREAIIKAFDDGGTRVEICEAFGLTYVQLTGILSRAGRCDRMRQAIGLTPEQAAVYHKLTRQKIGARASRKIAEAVAS
jgi:hypothetical protein